MLYFSHLYLQNMMTTQILSWNICGNSASDISRWMSSLFYNLKSLKEIVSVNKYCVVLKNSFFVKKKFCAGWVVTHTPWYFHALSALEHILISKDNQDADGFRFRNPYVQLYRLSFSTLVPCEPRKRYPPPNCLLRTHFIRFPCGTLDATISQVDNCIVTVRAQHFLQCLVFYLNHKSSLNYIFDTRVTWETWLRPNTVPSFEWCRYKRFSIFTRQGYSFY